MLNIAAGNPVTGYNLTRSLRTRASASAYLNRTVGAPTNNKIFTVSFWVKRGLLSSRQGLIGATNSGASNYWVTEFDAGNNLTIYDAYATGTTALTTTQVFRDPSAWYHIVVAVDTTQATASNRTKVYVNGSQVTSFSVSNYPSQNSNTYFNTSGAVASVGSWNPFSTPYYFDGYLTEINFIDGQALTPTSFGSYNSTTGVWQPARYTGTYGTNGFYLPFTDNSALTTSSNAGLGKDFSGNGNYWTTNNISITAGVTYDSMTDVPTLTSATAANFAVMNAVAPYGSALTLTEANLKSTVNGTYWAGSPATIGVSSGKWYWEVTVSNLTGNLMVGVTKDTEITGTSGINTYPGITANSYGYSAGGQKYNNATLTGYGASYTTNDVIGVAFDMDAGTLTFYKNNTSQGTAFSSLSGTYLPSLGVNTSPSALSINFGQRPFSYTPPTGYVALNTYNLPTATILKGNTVMDATLWNGTGASLSVINATSFKPDLVWVKSRSNATDHRLTDSVRGVTLSLATNSTNNEATNAQGLTAFNSNGFTLGTDADYNGSARTFVGWQWQAGQGTTSTNTSGTITSTVSVNASAGFSITTFSTPGGYTTATVGHGLGVAPAMYVVKNRTGLVINWNTYHQSLGNTQALYMNLTNAATTSSTFWNNTSPTSSVLSVGANLYASQPYVVYSWAEIAGFSKFGNYSGNGSADGPFVYTGFQPRFIMTKRTDTTGNWVIHDTARNTYNVADLALYPNLFNAEDSGASGRPFDILSNGFKARSTEIDINASGGTYIYAAFAENPFKNSLAR